MYWASACPSTGPPRCCLSLGSVCAGALLPHHAAAGRHSCVITRAARLRGHPVCKAAGHPPCGELAEEPLLSTQSQHPDSKSTAHCWSWRNAHGLLLPMGECRPTPSGVTAERKRPGCGNVCQCAHTDHARRRATDSLQLLQLLCLSLPRLQVSYHTHIPEYIPKYTWKGLVGPMWRVIRFNILMADLTLVPSNTMKVPHSPMQCSCWQGINLKCTPWTGLSLTVRTTWDL